MDAASETLKIPVMRPKLPAAEKLTPYLQKIDSSRTYSNFGPLVGALENRLAERFGLAEGTVTTVANATLGLTLALAAVGAKRGTLCAMPAWTFVASAHAAVMAGLIPYFIDVDPTSWAVDPRKVADMLAAAPAEVGAVMVVAPFGKPIDVAAWDRFQSRSKVPVVIDAAAGFDALRPAAAPAVVSMHATKVLGVGEGGFVVSTDPSIVLSVRRRSNFGFAGTREAAMAAANAKLSEYHAAVGLAALDEWSGAREEWMAIAQAYRDRLSQSNRLRFQEEFGQSWIASACMLELVNIPADTLQDSLTAAGIETRRWWGDGAHAHSAMSNFPRTALPATKTLAASTISLPFFRGLEAEQIHWISGNILEAVQG